MFHGSNGLLFFTGHTKWCWSRAGKWILEYISYYVIYTEYNTITLYCTLSSTENTIIIIRNSSVHCGVKKCDITLSLQSDLLSLETIELWNKVVFRRLNCITNVMSNQKNHVKLVDFFFWNTNFALLYCNTNVMSNDNHTAPRTTQKLTRAN